MAKELLKTKDDKTVLKEPEKEIIKDKDRDTLKDVGRNKDKLNG